MNVLTRRQREIYNYLLDNADSFNCPPSLDELCMRLGMASRGSLYKHIMALINAGLVEPFTGNKQAGIRLVSETFDGEVGSEGLPYVGAIAAGKPIDGEIVVALIENSEATLKYIEQTPEKILLLPANTSMSAFTYHPDQVQIQGVLVGQMRSYR